MKNIIRFSILGFIISLLTICPNYGQNKFVYIASPDVRGLEKGTNIDMFKTILLGKLEEYALNSDYQAVAREEAMQYMVNEIVVQQSGSVSSESIVKIGEWTGANFVLLSSVVGSNGYGTIKLNLYTTEKGLLVKAKSTSFQEDVRDFSNKAESVCKELFGVSTTSVGVTPSANRSPYTSAGANPTHSIGNSRAISLPGVSFEIASEDEVGFLTWEDAKLACSLRGSGWRLPTLQELKIMYFNKNQIGNLFGHERTTGYWSSLEKNKRNAYYFDIKDAETDDDDKSDADKCVRCVRSR